MQLRGARGEREDAIAKCRDSHLIERGSAIYVAIPAGLKLQKETCAEALALGDPVDGIQVAVDRALDVRGKRLILHRLEFALGCRGFPQVEVRASDLRTSRTVVRLHCKHTLESKDGLGIAAHFEGGDTEKIVVLGISGTLCLQRSQQLIGSLRLVSIQQGFRLQKDFVCGHRHTRETYQHESQDKCPGSRTELHRGSPHRSGLATPERCSDVPTVYSLITGQKKRMRPKAHPFCTAKSAPGADRGKGQAAGSSEPRMRTSGRGNPLKLLA